VAESEETALHVVPAILGSHQTTSTIAKNTLSAPGTICPRFGRHSVLAAESSPVMTTSASSSRQTVEHVARDGRAERVSRVDEPLTAEDEVKKRSRDS
jgi:hypothetical protein